MSLTLLDGATGQPVAPPSQTSTTYTVCGQRSLTLSVQAGAARTVLGDGLDSVAFARGRGLAGHARRSLLGPLPRTRCAPFLERLGSGAEPAEEVEEAHAEDVQRDDDDPLEHSRILPQARLA
jgi:hypothetical protein